MEQVQKCGKTGTFEKVQQNHRDNLSKRLRQTLRQKIGYKLCQDFTAPFIRCISEGFAALFQKCGAV